MIDGVVRVGMALLYEAEMQELNEIERRVLEKILEGEHPVLAQLRLQLDACQVVNREWTGSGFFTDFKIDSGASAATLSRDKIHFGDVVAEVQDITHGMGFMVNVVAGYLESLEGYTFEEPCPKDPKLLSLGYTNAARRDLSVLDDG